VLRFVLAQIRHRAGRSVALLLGVALAAASVVVLTGLARTSQIQITGTVERNFRSAYDIVVRPHGSKTPEEADRGLVQGNYLSGLYGGITMRQYHRIAELPGVEVAAPVANLGYLLVPQRVSVNLDDVLTGDPVQVYRITSSVSSDNGLSTYPGESGYVYFTRTGRFVQGYAGNNPDELTASGKRLKVCEGYWRSPDWPQDQDLLHPGRHWLLTCFSALTPERHRREFTSDQLPGNSVGYTLTFTVPVQVAAIDPVAEQQLVGLGDAVSAGRALAEDDKTRMVEVAKGVRFPTAPVIASTRTFLDDQLDIRVQRLQLPPADRVPELLATPRAYPLLTEASGTPVMTRTVAAAEIWPALLANYGKEPQFIEDYYSTKPVEYEQTSNGLRALDVEANRRTYLGPTAGGFVNYVPIDSFDTQVRKVVRHPMTNVITAAVGSPGLAKLQIVGTYDPDQLRGFSRLSAVPLTSYRPPDVRIAGDSDLAGQRLLPDRNLGGYITQPPLLLTTLKGMSAFKDSRLVSTVNPPPDIAAPISSIRVRVAGAPGIDPASQARIARVALDISRSTGLDVDVTIGSSPSSQTVLLPAGKYGRPELTVQEYWVKKGAAVNILEAVDRKSAALLALLGLVCALFVANTATAAIRARRPQFGVLACFGWSASRLFGAAVIELALLGAIGGAIGLGAAALVAAALDVHLLPDVVAATVPTAIVLSTLAGGWAANRAVRVTPADAVRPAALGAHRVYGEVNGVWGLALRGLMRVPGRTIVSALALAVSVAALTVLLGLTLAFQGTVAGNLLGQAVILEVTPADFIAVTVTAMLGAAVIAETLALEVRERAAELATLSATGWRDSRLARLLAYEGVGIGLAGSLLGAGVGFAAASLLKTPVSSLTTAALLAVVAGVVVAAAASVGPTLGLRRLSVPQLLAEE
jgi:putative ABC transport system permease protein